MENYHRSKPTCPFKNYVRDADYGYYSYTDGDCYSCKFDCDHDANCGAVECGRNQCTWWANGVCSTDEERTWNRKNANHDLQTCTKVVNHASSTSNGLENGAMDEDIVTRSYVQEESNEMEP